MSTSGAVVPLTWTNAVAVAVKGDLGGLSGSGGGKGSRRAVRWAAENLLPAADRLVLVHVMPTITSIPAPNGDRIPAEELDENLVKMFVEEMRLRYEEVFVPFKKLCRSRKVETMLLEDDDPASALIRYAFGSGIKSLVLGSCSANLFSRKQRVPPVLEVVMRFAPEACDVYVISGNDLVSKSGMVEEAFRSSFDELLRCLTRLTVNGSRNGTLSQKEQKGHSTMSNEQTSRTYSSSGESDAHDTPRASSVANHSRVNSQASTHMDLASITSLEEESNEGNPADLQIIPHGDAVSSSRFEKSPVQAEIEQLRLELHATVSMYERVCEELVHAQNKVQLLSSECVEETQRVNAATEREETLRKIADQQKAKYMETLKDIEKAKCWLANEEYKRQIAELNALKESSEKKKVVNALLLGDRRCRRYTRNEIEMATDNFSKAKVIGEGAYGKVYKCSLDHTPVAVKVIRSDAYEKKEEFLKEVEVLSQLRHPHMVLLLGASPESGCLIYEYMENGSLDEYIYRQNGRPSLPWSARFRIIFEVASALAFLHNSKPEPIVHRDLKPGNILLGRNYVSKIGDVGLAKLITDAVPDNVTEYRDSILAGTIYYMDPEYHRTGTVRPKSDLYAFGIIILQLLVGRHPKGLLLMVEEAISKGSLRSILDNSVRDWPVPETEELALIGLRCSKLRCRDRPDLDTEVLPSLKRISDLADASLKVGTTKAPSHYFCPILQEVMEDPYIAADGFTYEHRAIKAWLGKHKVSPVTTRGLPHTSIVPNHTLRSAIQEWRSRSAV